MQILTVAAFFLLLAVASSRAQEPAHDLESIATTMQNATVRQEVKNSWPQFTTVPLVIYNKNGSFTRANISPDNVDMTNDTSSTTTAYTTTETSTSTTMGGNRDTELSASPTVTACNPLPSGSFMLNTTGSKVNSTSLVITTVQANSDFRCVCTKINAKSNASGLELTYPVILMALLAIYKA
ncbi:uncharacterized protein LOC115632946 [Scaptodrosophila lebanonensis]|uniref:Uncharacterized protein LOC115632946 n=1 Tax=Drosophila lebanonensis TaxID=7225 RepID=A0A6J2UG66_DROLE|nr:uncharacterized protein LOC115632946 [Scaptodrosophila lebanonensis]